LRVRVLGRVDAGAAVVEREEAPAPEARAQRVRPLGVAHRLGLRHGAAAAGGPGSQVGVVLGAAIEVGERFVRSSDLVE